jgi:hypothetical protein
MRSFGVGSVILLGDTPRNDTASECREALPTGIPVQMPRVDARDCEREDHGVHITILRLIQAGNQAAESTIVLDHARPVPCDLNLGLDGAARVDILKHSLICSAS